MASAFHDLVANFDAPMFVVTAFDGHDRAGCLVGFTTQCAINTPRFLVCISVKNRTSAVARRSPVLAVHSLRDGQRDLAELFGATSGDHVDKFTRCAWHEGPHGAPVLDDCDWFAGPVESTHDLGDHHGFLVRVEWGSAAAPDVPRLGFQAVREIEAGHEA